ncbi:hypothetical protein CC79DRAFT_833073 [Sarocladium strictum]
MPFKPQALPPSDSQTHAKTAGEQRHGSARSGPTSPASSARFVAASHCSSKKPPGFAAAEWDHGPGETSATLPFWIERKEDKISTLCRQVSRVRMIWCRLRRDAGETARKTGDKFPVPGNCSLTSKGPLAIQLIESQEKSGTTVVVLHW